MVIRESYSKLFPFHNGNSGTTHSFTMLKLKCNREFQLGLSFARTFEMINPSTNIAFTMTTIFTKTKWVQFKNISKIKELKLAGQLHHVGGGGGRETDIQISEPIPYTYIR